MSAVGQKHKRTVRRVLKPATVVPNSSPRNSRSVFEVTPGLMEKNLSTLA